MDLEIQQYYNKIALVYDEDRFANTYGKYIHYQEEKVLERYLSKQEIAKNLDLACGTGRFLGYANYGVDFSPEMIKVSQQKFPNKNLQLSDAQSLPFQELSFKNVISFHLFMHLDEKSVKEILREVARVTKKRGYFIFDVPSEKRRKLTCYKSKTWHGGYQVSVKKLMEIAGQDWNLINVHGISFFPIHRIPKRVRSYFLWADNRLSNSLLKEYSSHLIFVLQKR